MAFLERRAYRGDPNAYTLHARAANEIRAGPAPAWHTKTENAKNPLLGCWGRSNSGGLNMGGQRTNRVTQISLPKSPGLARSHNRAGPSGLSLGGLGSSLVQACT